MAAGYGTRRIELVSILWSSGASFLNSTLFQVRNADSSLDRPICFNGSIHPEGQNHNLVN